MNIVLAQRLSQVKPSATLAVAAKATEMRQLGYDVIGLGTGEPDFDTPDFIKQAAIEAIQAGFTKYTPVDGILELKEAVKNKFLRDNNLNYDLKQILVSVGGKQSIYNLCQALLNPGDEVIIPAPYWVSYPDIVLLADAIPKIIPTDFNQKYKITPEQLQQAITPKTRLLFINSPSNPSGIAYTEDELLALAGVLQQHPNVIIATDDMYEHILWSQKFVNILNVCPDFYDRCVVLNGVSKAYAMTGWRIGFAAGPERLIQAMKKIQSQSTSNPCSIAQKAAVSALQSGTSPIIPMVKAFKERHDYIITRFNNMPDIDVLPSDGTFYSFPNVQKIIDKRAYLNDIAFAENLLTKEGVALVPGSAFGSPGSIRLSFACSMETLTSALDRIERFITE